MLAFLVKKKAAPHNNKLLAFTARDKKLESRISWHGVKVELILGEWKIEQKKLEGSCSLLLPSACSLAITLRLRL